MSTSLYLAVEDQDLLDGKWETINRERHMVDASEDTLKRAMLDIGIREKTAAQRDTVQHRTVTVYGAGVTSTNHTARSRTCWYIGEE